jgi:N-acetylmuramic acid 6-phosphate (MurNAc-6-P) etherase
VNAKLRERAVRIVAEVAGIEADRARTLLEASGWDIGAALDAGMGE